jgi:hypothetical protein
VVAVVVTKSAALAAAAVDTVATVEVAIITATVSTTATSKFNTVQPFQFESLVRSK